MMWYFSGKGNQGDSALFDGKRISKGDMIFELLGTLDEANAFLGLAISHCENSKIKTDLSQIQDDLTNLMGIIAKANNPDQDRESSLGHAIELLEQRMAEYEKTVQNPRAFLHPGKTALGAAIDITRTIIRRAERISVRHFNAQDAAWGEILAYLNRLSSFLYILRLSADLQ